MWPTPERELPELTDAGITAEVFKQGLLNQTLATAHELAHEKPMLKVNLDGPQREIEPFGFIK